MTYLALLRGINVGGNNKVDMKSLKSTFEHAGMTHVRTYINSGNIVFRSDINDAEQIAHDVESAIETDFGFPVRVLLVNAERLYAIAAALPDDWVNDHKTAKSDVMFLWDGADTPSVLDELTIKPDLDEVIYVPGALLWHVEGPKITRSGMFKIIGTELYRQMTVRNCNTLRKLAAIAREVDAE